MLEFLKHLDTQLFLFINGMHNSFFDFVMLWLSNKLIWIPFYLFLIYYFWKDNGKSVWLIVVCVAPLLLLSDTGSVLLFKNVFLRLRPSHTPALEGLVHLVNGYRGGNYGFISSHASNTFAIAVYANFFIPEKNKYLTLALLLWCLLVSYSRIYLGVHFPLDVICGALWGIFSGMITIVLFVYIQNKIATRTRRH